MATTPTMVNGKKVTIIPASKSYYPERDDVKPVREKKRVAAYCRVSTMMEEQQGSYNLQKSYYESFIKNNPAWEFAGIYGDEGKSGTSLRGRTGFLAMMDDVRAGKIDLIITKATSRFGRNNTEFMNILDELDSYGVEVKFESEGVLTSEQQNRIMLQVIGATNEHYSSTLSSNVRWSKERNMRSGKVTIAYKTFLGYEKGPDGEPKIVEEEAKIVRLIYGLFLDGKTYTYIAKYLTEHSIPTPTGKKTWGSGCVKSILTNEKYAGDAILQKTFRRNYKDKRIRKNDGEKPQVIVENNHEAIIDKATFAKAQELVKDREGKRTQGTGKSPFSGRVVCADCGEFFGHKTWTSRGRIKYSMWVCNHKYTEETSYGGDKCKTANLRQEWLESGYIYTMNQLLAHRGEYLAKYERKLARIDHRLSSGSIEKEIIKLDQEAKDIDERRAVLIGEWEFSYSDNNGFNNRFGELEKQAGANIAKKNELTTERTRLNAEKKKLESFIDAFKALPDKMERFNTQAFIKTIDHIEVGQYVLAYHLYGGECIKVNLSLIKKMI